MRKSEALCIYSHKAQVPPILEGVPTQWSTSALSASTNTPLLDLHGAEYNALVQEHSYSSTI